MKSPRVKQLLMVAFCVLASIPGFAQFSGDYAPANWTFSETSPGDGGSVNTSGAPASISMTSGDNGSGADGFYTITVVASGTLSFNWSYSTGDGANWDYPFYGLNGAYFFLNGYSTGGSNNQSGSQTLSVNAGDVFEFGMETTDGQFGPGTCVFSNFSAPSLTNCSGTPSGGTAAGPASACASNNFNITLTGATAGIGIGIQWQSSPAGAGTWTNISGATSSTLTTSLTSATDYQAVVSCSVTSTSATSNTVSVSVATAPDGGTATGPSSLALGVNGTFDATGTSGTLQWQVSSTLSTGPFTNISGATSASASIGFSTGGTYYIRCLASNGVGCTDDASNVLTLDVLMPGNNVCDAHVAVLGSNGPYTNIGAGGEVDEVVPGGGDCNSQTVWCNNTGDVNSVWLKFTPPTTGMYSFALSMTLFDSQFGLYQANACSPFSGFTLIAANDDAQPSFPYNSKIDAVLLHGGKDYYLLVDGYNNTTASGWGVDITNETVCNVPCPVKPKLPKKPAKPTVDITRGICPGESRTYTVAPNDTTVCVYAWSVPAGATITSGNGTESIMVDFDANFVGGGNIEVYAVNACGNSPVTTYTTKLGTAPKVSGIAGPGVAGCSMTGVPYMITGTSVPAFNYAWSWDPISSTYASIPVGNGSNNIEADFAFGFTQGTLSVSAENGCGMGSAKTFKVKNGPAPLAPTPVSGPIVGVCGQSGISYNVPQSGSNTYTWTFDAAAVDATVSGGQGTNMITADFGAGFVSGTLLVSTTDACATSKQTKYKIKAKIENPAVPSGPTVVCKNTTHSYSTSPVFGATGYNWQGPTGSTISDGINSAPGYPGGLTTSATTVDVTFGTKKGKVTVNALSACGNGKASLTVDTGCGVVKPAIQVIEASVLTVDLAPNPATEQVTVRINASNEGTALVRVLSITGQVMISQNINSIQHSQLTLPLNNLAAGLYMVEVVADGQKVTKQLMKQ